MVAARNSTDTFGNMVRDCSILYSLRMAFYRLTVFIVRDDMGFGIVSFVPLDKISKKGKIGT